MELKFSRQQLCTILESYFREEEDITGKVTIKATNDWVGYGMTEHRGCVTSIEIKGAMELAGTKIPLEKDITDEEVKIALSYFLDKTNHKVQDITFDKGTSTKTVGYGMCERDIETAYFKGVTVTIENKTKKIGGR